MIAYRCGPSGNMLSQLGAGARRCSRESARVPSSEESRASGKMQNSGNEAKKYLKIKDMTFLSAVNCVRFERNLAQI